MNCYRTHRISIKLLGLLALAGTSVPVLAAEKTELQFNNIQVINLNRSVDVGNVGNAQQVFIDSETKKIREANPEELQEQARKEASSKRSMTSSTKVSKTPSGAWAARLGEEHQSYSVVTRNADGSLSARCIDGKSAAEDHTGHSHTVAGASHDK